MTAYNTDNALQVDPRTVDPFNLELVATRMAAFNKRKGPRVGDFLKLPATDPRQGNMTRFTHYWGDSIQTGGMSGSFYLGTDYQSYSGGLDTGPAIGDILPTDETRMGSIWLFDRGMSGGGRGVYFTQPMRVFTLREGADTSNFSELRCPYRMQFWPPESRNIERHGYHSYTWTIEKHCMGDRAFMQNEEQFLRDWLASANLHAWRPLTETQFLQYQPVAA